VAALLDVELMIAKHLHAAKNCAGKLAEATARRGDGTAQALGLLANKIDALMREAVELMAK
jgi:hypothetical protein